MAECMLSRLKKSAVSLSTVFQQIHPKKPEVFKTSRLVLYHHGECFYITQDFQDLRLIHGSKPHLNPCGPRLAQDQSRLLEVHCSEIPSACLWESPVVTAEMGSRSHIQRSHLYRPRWSTHGLRLGNIQFNLKWEKSFLQHEAQSSRSIKTDRIKEQKAYS